MSVSFATKMRLAIAAHVPTLVLGLPGVGKTAGIKGIAKAIAEVIPSQEYF